MGIAAYKQTITETETPRQIERRVFSLVTSRLEQFQQEFDVKKDNVEKLDILANGLRHALWQNEQIWIAVKRDLAESENALSDDLRASLISLSIWVEKHTLQVLEGKAKVRPLLDINRNIIRGLEGVGKRGGTVRTKWD
jgi:flagellar biosynthesis activator protein FlaF